MLAACSEDCSVQMLASVAPDGTVFFGRGLLRTISLIPAVLSLITTETTTLIPQLCASSQAIKVDDCEHVIRGPVGRHGPGRDARQLHHHGVPQRDVLLREI
jgi:hypothetical protein